MAAGFPDQALSPYGREAKSMAFLSTPGDRVVVLRGHEQHRVRLADAPLHLHHLGWRVLLVVLVEPGDALQLEGLDRCPCGASWVAAREAARLYDGWRRLPAMPRMRIASFMPISWG
jgi:hypothetical protein